MTKMKKTEKGRFRFRSGVSGERQQAEFCNATMSTIGEDQRSISIAVEPSFPDGVDPLDATAVRRHLKEATRPLVAAGFKVEVQYGKF